jgi:hyperosmotically inducible periplasmic protein
MGKLNMKNGVSILKCVSFKTFLTVAFALLMINVSAFATATDDTIESAAKESYFFKTYLKNDNITVESKDGVVTLKGVVAEETHKLLAQEIVESIVGVVTVDNQLLIKAEMAESSDALISSRVRLAIMSHRTLRGVDIRFVVLNGNVTLYGMAVSTAQIDLTTEYIKDVDGVKDVKNEMGVNEPSQVEQTMGEKAGDAGRKIGDKVEDVSKRIGDKAGNVVEMIDDGSITAMVKAALMFHRSTSALSTKVWTRDGVVTLSGTAKNTEERELATKVVQDVHGVKDVVNMMGLEITQ